MGIDVGKAALDVAVDGVAGVPRFAYTPVGIGKLMGRLKGVADARVVVEATGGYEDAVLDACCDAGIWVARINPRQARDFARPPASWPRPMRSMRGCCACWRDCSPDGYVATTRPPRVLPRFHGRLG